MNEREDKQFENLLFYLQQNRGFDFSSYKRPSLTRRVSGRMQRLNIDNFADYTDYLEVHPEEFSQLFNAILINVTSFFRDPAAWAYLKNRVFAKTPQANARERLMGMAHLGNNEANPPRPARLTEMALDSSPVARIVVDASGNLAHADQKARLLFTINPKDIGRPLQDLEISYRPVELRLLIEQAYAERRSVTLTSIERRFPNGEAQYLDIIATPLYDQGNNPLGVAISFPDVTSFHRLQEDLQRSKEEIQTTTEELQSSNEELETTNEELQSSNEELETTNEELQSTNEELETMNEELQSANEELQTVNDELRQRTDELNNTNAFLQSVVAGLRSGAVVVNQNLNVLVWNPMSEELWGLRADEVRGHSLLDLDIGLPVEKLRAAVRARLAGEANHRDAVLDATNRRGKAIQCHISCTPLLGADKKPQGAILLMEAVKK